MVFFLLFLYSAADAEANKSPRHQVRSRKAKRHGKTRKNNTHTHVPVADKHRVVVAFVLFLFFWGDFFYMSAVDDAVNPQSFLLYIYLDSGEPITAGR